MGLFPRLVSRFAGAPLSKKLALVGGGIALFLLTALVANRFVSKDKAVSREMLGHDFLAFYTAGSFVRDGRSRELYRLDAVREFQQNIVAENHLDAGKNVAPWWNPPFYALAMAPLARLPYPAALSMWRYINLLALAAALGVLMAMIIQAAPMHWRVAGLVPLLVGISEPFIQATGHAQNTMLSLMLLTITIALWRAKRGLLAGLVGGLLFYKPQLAAVVAVVMLFDLGASTLIGLGVTGGILLALNRIMLPGTLGDWLHQVPANVRWIQVQHDYLWERHVTLKAFWRLLLQGRSAGETGWLTTLLTDLTVCLFGVRLLHAAWQNCSRRNDDRMETTRRDRLIAATVIVMPLLMPFYFDYDLMLLAVPATLLAIDCLTTEAKPGRPLVTAWIALGAWLYVNPPLAMHTHVDVTVLLLCAVGWLSLDRVNGQISEVVEA